MDHQHINVMCIETLEVPPDGPFDPFTSSIKTVAIFQPDAKLAHQLHVLSKLSLPE